MEILLLSIIAAMIPTAVYVGLIYWVDRYEKEPLWLLSAAFLWGAIPSIIAALIFNTLFSIPFFLLGGELVGDLAGAVLIAPVVEETLKGIALLLIYWFWWHHIDSWLDGIIYGAMVGMGFAMVENVFYFMSEFAAGGFEAWGINVFFRAVVFGLNHSLFTAMIGLGFAIARLSQKRVVRWSAPILGWMAGVFLHFMHNLSASLAADIPIFCLILPVNAWGGVLLTLVIMLWALIQERRWLRDYLQEEVALGTLTAAQYETIQSGRRRLRYYLTKGRSIFRVNLFFHLCSKLAYSKHHYELLQDEASRQAVVKLRQAVQAAAYS
jgi:protease PrsW